MTVGRPDLAVRAADHPASDGIKTVVFNPGDESGFGASLSQTFRTVPGQRYGLAFDVGAVGTIADQKFRVVVEGKEVVIDTTIVVAAISTEPFFVPQHLSFTADADRTILTFHDRSSAYVSADGLLDNVRLTAESVDAPRIIEGPSRAAAMQGQDATFEAIASGPPPLTYQWEFNGHPIPGATGTKYVVRADDLSRAGNYSVTVSNAAGTVLSSAATLTVLPAGILANGSFEYGIAGWTFSTPYITMSPNTSYGVTDGRAMIHFNWGQHEPGGTMSQVFATERGREYTLGFDVGAFSLVNRGEQRIRVTVAGESRLVSEDISVHANGRGGTYQRKSYAFVADSDRATLTFEDISTITENIDALLDNVKIEAVTGSGPAASVGPESEHATNRRHH